MIALVTGGGGFIGSTLAQLLLDEGWDVTVVDSVTDYYDPAIKLAHLTLLESHTQCTVIRGDLITLDLEPLLDGVDVVFHQAGQPGVRLSWADSFRTYNDLNVNVTQRLLEAARRSTISRFVFASSSSIYGDAASYPTSETAMPQPQSPYGVTKLAAELLCAAYASNFRVPVTSLRYFSVYGPRQRPDMGIHRMVESAIAQTPFGLFGDGSHIRDFTFVGDVARANLLAATADLPTGTVMNIAGGSSTTVRKLIELVGATVGQAVPIDQRPAQPGDVARTGGSVELARDLLGWVPRTSLADGVAAQVEWHRSLRASP